MSGFAALKYNVEQFQFFILHWRRRFSGVMGLDVRNKVTSRYVELAVKLLKSLANTHRLRLVCALLDGERSVGQLVRTLGIPQPSLSQQLGEFREIGLVAKRRAAKQVFYRLADERAAALIAILQTILAKVNPATSPLRPASPNKTSAAAQFVKVRPI